MRFYFNKRIITGLVLSLFSVTVTAETLSCPPAESFFKNYNHLYGWSWDVSMKKFFPHFIENKGMGFCSPYDTPFISSSTLAVSIVYIRPTTRPDGTVLATRLSLICSYYLDSSDALNNKQPDVEINFDNLFMLPDVLKELTLSSSWLKGSWNKDGVDKGEDYSCMTTAGDPGKCNISVLSL